MVDSMEAMETTKEMDLLDITMDNTAQIQNTRRISVMCFATSARTGAITQVSAQQRRQKLPSQTLSIKDMSTMSIW
jgi:hypothetical protein